MGNNAAYEFFEHTIITLYDKGVLDLELLDTLAKEYAGTDIDSGGSRELRTKDGKELREVCLELVSPSWVEMHPAPEGFSSGHEENDREWTDEDEAYNDAAESEWYKINRKRWGWR